MKQDFDIQLLKAGDERAFRTLVESFQDRVFNTCLGFVENRMEAEDVTQEVFVQVFTSIKHFREEAQLSTWIYRIAVTKSLELLRSKKRKKRLAFVLRLVPGERDTEMLHDTAAHHPLSQIENKEDAEALYAALNKLPDNQRIAFTLRKIEDLSQQEIAAIMDITESAVESLLYRAQTNLRGLLHAYYEKNL